MAGKEGKEPKELAPGVPIQVKLAKADMDFIPLLQAELNLGEFTISDIVKDALRIRYGLSGGGIGRELLARMAYFAILGHEGALPEVVPGSVVRAQAPQVTAEATEEDETDNLLAGLGDFSH